MENQGADLRGFGVRGRAVAVFDAAADDDEMQVKNVGWGFVRPLFQLEPLAQGDSLLTCGGVCEDHLGDPLGPGGPVVG